jgi:serine/threonine protein kinase
MALPVPATTGMLRSLGPYQLQEVLGEGGMGVVYLAVHRSSGERVAIKTVKVPHEQHLAGIRREIQALSRLRHPGVVRVLETGFQDSVPWYAMEYLEGETLGSLKERGFEGSAARFASGEVRVPRAARAAHRTSLRWRATRCWMRRRGRAGPCSARRRGASCRRC